jgi:hypothetical protein
MRLPLRKDGGLYGVAYEDEEKARQRRSRKTVASPSRRRSQMCHALFGAA